MNNPEVLGMLSMRERIALIREDCRNDAATADGLPLSGLVIGTRLGQIYAMIDALAACILEQEDRLDSLAQVVGELGDQHP